VERTISITTEKASMKSHWIISGALASAIFLAPVHAVQARTVKGQSKRVATLKKVSTKEYGRLVGKKVAARVTGSGGASCTLRHPENRSINLSIRKDELRLDPAGAIPNCEDFQAMVECEGMETPKSSPEGTQENSPASSPEGGSEN
jgi:hypothetical protein